MYLDFQEESNEKEDETKEMEQDEIGGLFKKVTKEQHQLKQNKDVMNLPESSLMLPWNAIMKDWTLPEVGHFFTNLVILNKINHKFLGSH